MEESALDAVPWMGAQEGVALAAAPGAGDKDEATAAGVELPECRLANSPEYLQLRSTLRKDAPEPELYVARQCSCWDWDWDGCYWCCCSRSCYGCGFGSGSGSGVGDVGGTPAMRQLSWQVAGPGRRRGQSRAVHQDGGGRTLLQPGTRLRVLVRPVEGPDPEIDPEQLLVDAALVEGLQQRRVGRRRSLHLGGAAAEGLLPGGRSQALGAHLLARHRWLRAGNLQLESGELCGLARRESGLDFGSLEGRGLSLGQGGNCFDLLTVVTEGVDQRGG